MRRITRRASLQAGLAGFGFVAAPFILRSASAQSVRTLKLAYSDTPSSPFRPVFEAFAEDIKSRTAGALDVKVFTTGELGSQANLLAGLQTGIIDLCVHSAGFVEPLFPPFGILNFPYLFPSTEAAEKVLDGAVGDRLLGLMPSKGIVPLGWGDWTWKALTTVDRPVDKPAAMQGLKVRVQPAAVILASYKALGAVPIAVDISETYVALAQHTVTGIDMPLYAVVANKFYEVAKVANKTHIMMTTGVSMASKRVFDGLQASHQSAIRDAGRNLTSAWRKKAQEIESGAEQSLKSNGVRVVSVDEGAYRAITRPVYEQFRQTVGSDLLDQTLKQIG